jgi:hypothetical protein
MLPEPQQPGDREILARWAKHQKIGWRFWNTWLRPAPFLSPWQRRLGYAWRSIAALLVLTIAGYAVAQQLASTASYSRSVSATWRQSSGLPQLSLSPLQWKGKSVSAESFFASSANGAIESIEVSAISGAAPARFGTSSSAWNLGALQARSMAVVMRTAPPFAEGEPTLGALSQHFTFDSLTVTHALSLVWPGGRLQADGAVLRPGSLSNILDLRGNALDVFPLNGLPLHALRLMSHGEAWQIADVVVAPNPMTDGAESVPVEVDGTFDGHGNGSLKIRTTSLDLSYLLPAKHRNLLTGSTALDLSVSLSPDRGHRALAELAPAHIQIHNVAFFELLATFTGRPKLRSPHFSSGIITLECPQASTIILAPLRLTADGLITLEGSIAIQDGSISATLGVGLPFEVLSAVPEWRGTAFREGQDSLYWREFDFRGKSLEEASATGTAQLSDLFAALRQARERRR